MQQQIKLFPIDTKYKLDFIQAFSARACDIQIVNTIFLYTHTHTKAYRVEFHSIMTFKSSKKKVNEQTHMAKIKF